VRLFMAGNGPDDRIATKRSEGVAYTWQIPHPASG